jgi:O-antigen/teichoic acid export membrane protein
MSDDLKRFVSQSAVLMFTTGVSAVLSAVYVALTGRWLGPEEYGAVTAVLSLANLFSLVLGPLDTGLAKFAATYDAEDAPGKLATLAFNSLRRLLQILGLGLLLWLPATFLVSGWLHLEGVSPLLWLTAFSSAAVLTTVPRGTLRGEHRFLAFGVNQVAESAVRLAVGTTVMAFGAFASAALAGYAAGGIGALAFGLWQIRSLRRPPRVVIDTRPLWAFSIPLLFISFYGIFVTNADMLVAKHALSESDAGLYGAATSVARLLFLAVAPVLTVLFSRIAALKARNQSSRRLVLSVCIPLAAGLLGSLALPWFWGEELLRLAFGGRFAGGAPVLRILWLTTCLFLLQNLGQYVLLGADRTRASWAFLLPCALMVVLFWQFHGSATEVALCSLAAVVAGLVLVVVLLLAPSQALDLSFRETMNPQTE